MKHVTRLSVMLLIAFTAGLTTSQANLLQSTLTLPPPGGVYSLPVHCIAPACLVNAQFYGFLPTMELFDSGNEFVTATAHFSSDVYQNVAGAPGALLGSVSAPGTVNITYFGRTLAAPLGTFNAQLTDFLFSGMFNGHSFVFKQSSVNPSLGQTSIDLFSNTPVTYQVSSFFDVFGQFSIDGAPFVPGPGVHTVVSAVPEPGSTGLALSGLVACGGLALRKRRALR